MSMSGTILQNTYAQIRYYRVIEDHEAILAESDNQPTAENGSFVNLKVRLPSL